MHQKREYSKDDLDRVRELGRNNASVTAVASAPDFVNAYPKIHQQTMERYVDAVS